MSHVRDLEANGIGNMMRVIVRPRVAASAGLAFQRITIPPLAFVQT